MFVFAKICHHFLHTFFYGARIVPSSVRERSALDAWSYRIHLECTPCRDRHHDNRHCWKSYRALIVRESIVHSNNTNKRMKRTWIESNQNQATDLCSCTDFWTILIKLCGKTIYNHHKGRWGRKSPERSIGGNSSHKYCIHLFIQYLVHTNDKQFRFDYLYSAVWTQSVFT